MAGTVNYLMNTVLQGLGFCFLQMKNGRKKKRCNLSEILLDVFQACGVSFLTLPPEKNMSISELGRWKEEESYGKLWAKTWGEALAVTEGFLLFWEWMELEVWGNTQGQKGTVNTGRERGKDESAPAHVLTDSLKEEKEIVFFKAFIPEFYKCLGLCGHVLYLLQGPHCSHSGQTMRNGKDKQNR